MKFDPPKRMEYLVCIILGRELQDCGFHSGVGSVKRQDERNGRNGKTQRARRK